MGSGCSCRRTRAVRGDVDNAGSIREITPKTLAKHPATLKTTDDKKEASQLKPEKVDFHVSTNCVDHHTDEYDTDSLIVRRGQGFKVSVTFDRPFDTKQDKLVLQLTIGCLPQESKQSLIHVKETDHLSTSSWGMRIEHIDDNNTVFLTIMSPANALVGEYSFYVETKTKKSGSEDEYLTFRKPFDETLVVLFNAWCKDDTVYMDNEEHRNEYVLNDQGRIWVGNARRNEGIPWYFGQFEKVSLKSCLYLLMNCSNFKQIAHGNPVLVSRSITEMANSSDADNGVLVGNWSGNFSGGTKPSLWTGSVAILEEFTITHKSVMYGQCWVFSGVVTTLLRSIGIPTRSVTNFESAHDSDASMTIDFHFDKNDEPLDFLNDSVWNFHVWNESYFDRPDLPGDYGGWQALDATPQEPSEGVYCCGPCPIKAIKSGEVYLPYDTKFLFGEVNGDRVYWEVHDDEEMKVSSINKWSIGKLISTKAVGSDDRDDVTNYYKHEEGGLTEQQAVRRAHQFSSRRDYKVYKDEAPHDVIIDFYQPDDLMIGSDFDAIMLVKNKSKEKRTVHFTMTTTLAFYTGINAKHLHTVRDQIVVPGEEEKSITFPIAAADYIGKSPSDVSVKIVFKSKIMETGYEFNDIETVQFKKPTIQASLPDKISEKESFETTLSFINPLPTNLTMGVFKIESSRHLSPDTITKHLNNPVQPNEKAECVLTLRADQAGDRSLTVAFTSDQLSGVCGKIELKVETTWDTSSLPGYL